MTNEEETVDPEIKQLFEGEHTLAKYKIEVMVGPDRSGFKDFKAILSIHESGKHFHGGGDAGMYLCMDHRSFENINASALPLLRTMRKEKRTERGCGSPIPNSVIVGPLANCPGCGNIIDTKFLTGQIPYYGSIGGLVEMVEILFDGFKGNADIYLKHFKYDIRYDLNNTKAERYKFQRAMANIESSIYPLYRILKDTSTGAKMPTLIRAFLLS